MKVFGCRNDESYGGGLVLVAANTKEEASEEGIKYCLENLI